MSVNRQYLTGAVVAFRQYEIAHGDATRHPSERHTTVDLQAVSHDAAIRLDHEAKAILVGEPPRGRPNTVGDVETLVLPRSGLRVDYSTKEYKRMPELADAAYLPIDVPILSRWADFIAGRDPILEAVIDYGSGGD